MKFDAIDNLYMIGLFVQISVVRMIIKDTIEHQLYTRNNDQDVRQVEFNFDDENVFGGPQVLSCRVFLTFLHHLLVHGRPLF